MLKFLFWSLVLANAVLFSYQRGYLGAWIPDGHEPARMAQQFNADKMKPLTAETVAALSAGTTSAEIKTTEVKPDAVTCSEVGNFDAVTAKRFEEQLLPLILGSKLSRRDIQEPARNMVYIPSQGTKEGADKKAAELRRLGVNDFYIIQEAGELHFGISLGIFKTEEGARAQLAALNLKGVHSARLGSHNVAAASKVAFQLRNLDANEKAGLDKVTPAFPQAEMHSCEPNADEGSQAAPLAKKENMVEQNMVKQVYPRDAIH